MKATGIVRRIDDLGRVVIPKEIRRTMRIREGDPLEIYTEKDGEVIFKKYSPMGELSEFATQICDSLHKATGCVTVVCDRDSVIATAGASRRELHDKRISADLEQIMEARCIYRPEQGPPNLPLLEGEQRYVISVAAPILSEGDISGCIVFVTKPDSPPAGELEFKLAQTVAGFLGRQLEG
jgi:AbrB family transcriptional regulator (stage V sporulation protein T)